MTGGLCCTLRTSALGLVLLFGAGCSVKDPSRVDPVSTIPATHGLVGEPDFNWHLSGDRRVAPRQVFSDAIHVWVQWHVHQALPIIMGHAGDGHWQVVDYRQHGQYTVIQGYWPELRFQGGQLIASAAHRLTQSSACASQPAPSAAPFELRLSDKTIRQALGRWAHESHWYFEDSHWDVPVDLPVSAAARFSGDFPSAVTQLLAATEASGRSLQACFYGNHVLRVIPRAQSCDPSDTPADRT
jgi:hypothetical protein